MTHFVHLLGKEVEVVYRYGEAELFACGVLLGFSDDFILVEQGADPLSNIPKVQLKVPYSWIRVFRQRLPSSLPPDTWDDPM